MAQQIPKSSASLSWLRFERCFLIIYSLAHLLDYTVAHAIEVTVVYSLFYFCASGVSPFRDCKGLLP